MVGELAITHILERNGLPLADEPRRLLAEYERLLREWNAKVNLVSRRDVENIAVSHILHSLSMLLVVAIRTHAKVLDLGTGGGLPGIPLAIARPDLDVVLLDSIGKKIRAVDDMLARLGVRNVQTRCARAEDLKSEPGFAGAFDVIVSRGVATLSDLIRWAEPLVRRHPAGVVGAAAGRSAPLQLPEPYLLCLKGGDLDGEIDRARKKLGRREIRVIDIAFPHGEAPPLEEKKLVIVMM